MNLPSYPKADVIETIATQLATEARWVKAVQYLRDCEVMQYAPQDIGPLIKLVQKDVEDECILEIQDALFQWAWPQIKRRLTAGLPEWYKQLLLLRQFATDDAPTNAKEPEVIKAGLLPSYDITPNERPAGCVLDAPYPWKRDENPDVVEAIEDLPTEDGSEPDCEVEG